VQFRHTIHSTDGIYWTSIPSDPQMQFEAIHMALIPKGTDAGKVLVWDRTNITLGGDPPVSWIQRWSVMDPEAQTFQNYSLEIPGANGDFFCAGHAWTWDGRLLVTGGTAYVSPPPPIFLGLRVTYLFNPDDPAGNGRWRQQQAMDRPRWYPTVTLLGDASDRMVVTGGSNTFPDNPPTDTAINTYEVFLPGALPDGIWESVGTTRVWPGPRTFSDHPFWYYPRAFALSERAYGGPAGTLKTWLFMGGMYTKSARLDHVSSPGVWPSWNNPMWPRHPNSNPTIEKKLFGSAVLFPGQEDTVLHVGGTDDSGAPIPSAEYFNNRTAPSQNPVWTPASAMYWSRSRCNAVILPDGTVLVVGGTRLNGPCDTGGTGTECPVHEPEVYVNGGWTRWSPHASPRTYHSTAVLLPSGKVLVGGGDTRTWDYEVFSPPYLAKPNRPVWVTWPTTAMGYDATLSATFETLPLGVTVEKVVLIAPGSVTHHSDMHQRYVSLEIESSETDTVTFRTPKNRTYAPRGWYMMFLVTDQGLPSVAKFVRLQ